MSKKEIVKRYVLCVVSLFISALGVAVTKHGELGVSPISSVSNVLCEKFPAFSLGTWLFIWNCALILGQVALLRKNFKPIQLLQVPMSLLFGVFTDIGTILVKNIPAEIYAVKILLVIAGTMILGLGIALAVIANAIMNSGEAFVKAVSDVSGKDFGNLKIIFDILCVITAAVLSLIFFSFRLRGIREGTIIAAATTGLMVKLFTKLLKDPMEKMLRA
ncbi:MAG: YitT family protein [Ruminococcus sp.]|nr:YitT family protein [Ruminococcus sp.]MBP3380102.1 YitT family protein [Ruminococcus sp.]